MCVATYICKYSIYMHTHPCILNFINYDFYCFYSIYNIIRAIITCNPIDGKNKVKCFLFNLYML